jgi:hypothetical protein
MGGTGWIRCMVSYRKDSSLAPQALPRMTCKPSVHILKSPKGLAADSRSCNPLFLSEQVHLASSCACSFPIEDPLEVSGSFVVIVEVRGQVLFEACWKHHPSQISAKEEECLMRISYHSRWGLLCFGSLAFAWLCRVSRTITEDHTLKIRITVITAGDATKARVT